MTAVVFRLFGRPEVPVVDPASATGQARPARRAADLLAPRRRDQDPPTDPFGFPAIGGGPWDPVARPSAPGRAAAPGWAAGWAPPAVPPTPVAAPAPRTRSLSPAPAPSPADRSGGPEPAACSAGSGPHQSEPVPHPAEAAALGAAFAADYLSWDEDAPERRARVLGDYLAARRPVRLGWSGRGRQRADLSLPGLVRPDGEGRVLVDVRVRVTPYQEVPGRRPTPEEPGNPESDEGPAVPSAAPAPAARGWRGLPAQWVRLSVAVVVDGDRLVVDAEEETDDPWPTAGAAAVPQSPQPDLENAGTREDAPDRPDAEDAR